MNPSPKEKIINHCIYCGKNDQLSDEHATPHGLGGKWILRKASCEECRKITSRFEARILKGVLYKYRSYKKFPSRSKYDSLKSSETYRVRDRSGNISEREIDMQSIGIHLFMPEFAEPRFLVPNPKIEGIEIRGIHYTRSINQTASLSGVDAVKINQDFPTSDFIRLLAKMALCHTLLRYEEGDLKIFIRPLIRDEVARVEDWIYVGSPTKPNISKTESGIRLFSTGKWVWCEIKPLRDSPAVYKVIVGKLKFRALLKAILNGEVRLRESR